MTAEARVLQCGSRIATVLVHVRDASETLKAVALVSYAISG